MTRGLDAGSLLAKFVVSGPSGIEEEGVPDGHVAASDEEVHGRLVPVNLCPDLCVSRGGRVFCLNRPRATKGCISWHLSTISTLWAGGTGAV